VTTPGYRCDSRRQTDLMKRSAPQVCPQVLHELLVPFVAERAEQVVQVFLGIVSIDETNPVAAIILIAYIPVLSRRVAVAAFMHWSAPNC